MTDWPSLSARGGLVCHDVVGWMMWDERAKASFGRLGMPNTDAWVVAWRLAALRDTPHPVETTSTETESFGCGLKQRAPLLARVGKGRGHENINAVGLALNMIVNPGEFLLDTVWVLARQAQNSEATGL